MFTWQPARPRSMPDPVESLPGSCRIEGAFGVRSLVQGIIALAHALRLQVVAEEVETEAQRRILLELGRDEFQGNLFARPMAAERITE